MGSDVYAFRIFAEITWVISQIVDANHRRVPDVVSDVAFVLQAFYNKRVIRK